MDKLYLAGRNLGRVLGYRCGRVSTQFSTGMMSKQPNLMLKIKNGQLLGYLPLAIDRLYLSPTCHNLVILLLYAFRQLKKHTDVCFSLSMWCQNIDIYDNDFSATNDLFSAQVFAQPKPERIPLQEQNCPSNSLIKLFYFVNDSKVK